MYVIYVPSYPRRKLHPLIMHSISSSLLIVSPSFSSISSAYWWQVYINPNTWCFYQFYCCFYSALFYFQFHVCIHSVTFLNFLVLQVISYLVSAAASDLDGVIDDLRLSADKALLDVVQGRLDVLRLKLGETLILLDPLYLTQLPFQLFLSTLPKVLSRYMYIWRSPKKDRSNKAKLIRAYV